MTALTDAGRELVDGYSGRMGTHYPGSIWIRLRDVDDLRRVAEEQGVAVQMWPDWPQWPPRSWYE